MMIMMMMMMMTCAMAARKKERVPMWIQATLTDGNAKGALEWIKPNASIEPRTIHAGFAKDLREDGYSIPDFVTDGTRCAVMIDRADIDRQAVLAYQPTATRKIFAWILDVETEDDLSHPSIDTLHTDEEWILHFTRAKKEFSPYKMSAVKKEDV